MIYAWNYPEPGRWTYTISYLHAFFVAHQNQIIFHFENLVLATNEHFTSLH